jgi:hypothetical protein
MTHPIAERFRGSPLPLRAAPGCSVADMWGGYGGGAGRSVTALVWTVETAAWIRRGGGLLPRRLIGVPWALPACRIGQHAADRDHMRW